MIWNRVEGMQGNVRYPSCVHLFATSLVEAFARVRLLCSSDSRSFSCRIRLPRKAQHLPSGEQASLVESGSINNYSDVPLTEAPKAKAGDKCGRDHNSLRNEGQEEQRRVRRGDPGGGRSASAVNINVQGALLHAVTDLVSLAYGSVT